MPYLILIIGVIIGIGAFYLFFLKASPDQVKRSLSFIGATIYAIVMLFFAVTGKMIIALIMLIPIIPVALRYFRKQKEKNDDQQ